MTTKSDAAQPTTPTPVTVERLRELREKQFVRVLNTPRPTIEQLEKILQQDDVRVEILPSGEVRAVDDAYRELIVAVIDELLAARETILRIQAAHAVTERDACRKAEEIESLRAQLQKRAGSAKFKCENCGQSDSECDGYNCTQEAADAASRSPAVDTAGLVDLIEELRNDFINIVVGGCTCGTKPPDPALHELNCHYRMAETGLARIEKHRAALPPLTTPATRETADLRREVEGMRKDAARRIELARNEGFREGWMRCGAYHIDVCFESPDEHAEVDRRLAALAATRKGETT